MEEDEFKHRCVHTPVGACFHWRGITVQKYGNEKFLCEGQRGNWKTAFNKMKETAMSSGSSSSSSSQSDSASIWKVNRGGPRPCLESR